MKLRKSLERYEKDFENESLKSDSEEVQNCLEVEKRRLSADIRQIVTEVDNKINKDARNYQKYLKKLTRFVVCGFCFVDDSRNKVVAIDKLMRYSEAVELSFSNNQYVNAVRDHFDNNGVLKMSRSTVRCCGSNHN